MAVVFGCRYDLLYRISHNLCLPLFIPKNILSKLFYEAMQVSTGFNLAKKPFDLIRSLGYGGGGGKSYVGSCRQMFALQTYDI